MYLSRAAFALFFVLAFGDPAKVAAQITFDGCVDIRGIPVASVLDESIDDVANASIAADGRPIIRYNPRVLAWFTPQARLWLYGHECGHHALGHNFGTAHPLSAEQQADCWGIRTLVARHELSRQDVKVIQADLSRLARGDWTHLPGPIRAINLGRCLTARPNGPVEEGTERLYCCDEQGRRRCMITRGNPGMGGPCVCDGIPGVGRVCR